MDAWNWLDGSVQNRSQQSVIVRGKDQHKHCEAAIRDRLLKLAYSYLAKRSTSTHNITRYLVRAVFKTSFEKLNQEQKLQIDEVLETLCRLKLLDDQAFIASKITSYRQKGRSKRVICERLFHHYGLSREMVMDAFLLLEPNSHRAELCAAQRSLRRMLGLNAGEHPLMEQLTPSLRQKLYRQGFSIYNISDLVDFQDAYETQDGT